MNIIEKAINLRAKWIRDHDEEPKFLIVGPREWEQLNLCVRSEYPIGARDFFYQAAATSSFTPVPAPNGWDSGRTLAEMRVIVFERPMLLVSNNRTSGAPQSDAEQP